MEFFDMTDMHRAHIADADKPETDFSRIHHVPFLLIRRMVFRINVSILFAGSFLLRE